MELTLDQETLLQKFSREIGEKLHRKPQKTEIRTRGESPEDPLLRQLREARARRDETAVERLQQEIALMDEQYGRGGRPDIGESRTTLSAGSAKMGHNNQR